MRQLIAQLVNCISIMLAFAVHHVAIAQTSAEDEPLIKAAYIYNFAKYTSWPEKIWQTQDVSLNLCTVGDDDLIVELKKLGGKTIKRHPLTILPLKDMKNKENCQLLYIATSEMKRYKDTLKSMHGEPVLTVSELDGFSRSGGIIELYREKNQIRFIINLAVARQAGLAISSRLLILADVIDNGVTP